MAISLLLIFIGSIERNEKPGKLILQNDKTRIERCKTMCLQSRYDVTNIMNYTQKQSPHQLVLLANCLQVQSLPWIILVIDIKSKIPWMLHAISFFAFDHDTFVVPHLIIQCRMYQGLKYKGHLVLLIRLKWSVKIVHIHETSIWQNFRSNRKRVFFKIKLIMFHICNDYFWQCKVFC